MTFIRWNFLDLCTQLEALSHHVIRSSPNSIFFLFSTSSVLGHNRVWINDYE